LRSSKWRQWIWPWLVFLCLVSGCNDQSADSSAKANGATGQTATAPTVTSGTATVSWDAPTANTSGTALTDLAGYRIYYGMSASDLSHTVQIATVGIQTYVIDNLDPGTWYFAVAAVTSAGTESALSEVVSKTIG